VRRATATLLLLAACAPDLGPPAFLVDRPKILAIQSVPAEVAAGASAVFHVLAADPSGPLEVADASWALCTTPLSLTSSGTVSAACQGDLPTVAQGQDPSIATSANACSVFGPIASSGTLRPRDPDSTGGYFQPVRAQLLGATAFAQERLLCPLGRATLALSLDFSRRYKANQNPVITGFDAPSTMAAGQQVQLAVSWDQSSVEVYPVFDAANLRLVDTAEVLDVSWYATGGTLQQDRTAANGLGSSNTWTAPASGTVFFWAVLHDSRGGLDFAQLQTAVGGP
jgi:hypothetical protein